MTQFSRLHVLISMINVGVVPVFYHPDPRVVINVVNACLDGGAHCFEFTNRGDRAFEVFAEVIKHLKDDARLILGAGSVIEPYTANQYIQLGANFIVGPNLNPEVARLCNRRKVAYSPGCGTVSEISQAEELGAEICKVFPAGNVGGPSFVKNVLGPMPWARLMPTSGVEVSEDSITSWIKAGAVCVGIGSNLFSKKMLESGDFAEITRKIQAIIGWVQAARGENNPIH
ncbi:MAG: bifunctional 4-hydroxy-2-oxoglutarate aldolase/2-dehydro-3-deoxy-phosphogluconate aldolase [Chloroflexi bacterium 44-23]|nr:MAG: bifunctional 4-hydroxy-2-oxoglutarate aldolase/2-dehydro-3-deoxy-phosphogluconate aldolase [Chloroflexi bacterium 44-23]